MRGPDEEKTMRPKTVKWPERLPGYLVLVLAALRRRRPIRSLGGLGPSSPESLLEPLA